MVLKSEKGGVEHRLVFTWLILVYKLQSASTVYSGNSCYSTWWVQTISFDTNISQAGLGYLKVKILMLTANRSAQGRLYNTKNTEFSRWEAAEPAGIHKEMANRICHHYDPLLFPELKTEQEM